MKTFRRRRAAAIALAAAALLGACGGEDTPAGGGSASPATETVTDAGDLTVEFATPKAAAYGDYPELLRDFVNESVSAVNELLALPEDIPMVFAEIGEENAYYDPEQRTITFGYELVAAYVELAPAVRETEDEQDQFIYANVENTMLHELGHALIDILELPVLGKEEDAADGLATLIQIEAFEEGTAYAIDVADGWAAVAESPGSLDESAFADEHSLNAQRFYATACWVAGSSDDAMEQVEAAEVLPPERLERCPEEYELLAESWSAVLDPYLKS
ncbi:MAG TPA: DUF4344 domain-containing metallopeptidase [Actinomycetota bacterium]|nr:DUF4344 domain-containing metallopeptidase [Actinomycetota bacterium]